MICSRVYEWASRYLKCLPTDIILYSCWQCYYWLYSTYSMGGLSVICSLSSQDGLTHSHVRANTTQTHTCAHTHAHTPPPHHTKHTHQAHTHTDTTPHQTHTPHDTKHTHTHTHTHTTRHQTHTHTHTSVTRTPPTSHIPVAAPPPPPPPPRHATHTHTHTHSMPVDSGGSICTVCVQSGFLLLLPSARKSVAAFVSQSRSKTTTHRQFDETFSHNLL